jgi:hypothetical protein
MSPLGRIIRDAAIVFGLLIVAGVVHGCLHFHQSPLEALASVLFVMVFACFAPFLVLSSTWLSALVILVVLGLAALVVHKRFAVSWRGFSYTVLLASWMLYGTYCTGLYMVA